MVADFAALFVKKLLTNVLLLLSGTRPAHQEPNRRLLIAVEFVPHPFVEVFKLFCSDSALLFPTRSASSRCAKLAFSQLGRQMMHEKEECVSSAQMSSRMF